MDQYREAHLFVAAVRVVEHRIGGGAAGIDDVCSMLQMSLESGYALCRKLNKLGVINLVEDPFSQRVVVADHLRIEEISREENNENSLAKEVEQFKAKKRNMEKEVEAIQADLERKRKATFTDIEERLKKEMGRKNR